MIKFGEFAPDVADYNLEVASVAENCLPTPNGYRNVGATSVVGTTTLSGSLSSVPIIWEWDQSGTAAGQYEFIFYIDGVSPIFLQNGSEFQKLSGLARVSAFSWLAPVNYKGDLYIFGVDPAQKIAAADMATATTTKTSDVGGTPPDAQFAATVGQHIVVGYTVEAGTEYPYRLYWSGFAAPDSWTVGDNQSGTVDLQQFGAIRKIVGGDYGIIFQERGIVRMDYVGSPQVWEFSTLSKTIGTPSPLSVVEVGNVIYFWSFDGFYALENGQSLRPIGVGKVDQYVQQNSASSVPHAGYRAITGAKDDTTNTIWWAWIKDDGSAKCDYILVYNPKLDRWSTIDPGLTNIYGLYSHNLEVNTTDNDILSSVGVLNYDGTSIDRRKFREDTVLAATIETGHIFDENYKTEINGVRPICDIPGQVSILTKADELNDAESTSGPTTPNGSGVADFRVEGKYHRIRWTNGSTAFKKAAGVVVDQSPSGDR